MTDTDTRLVYDTLTVGELRRLLDGLDDQLPVNALRLAASPGANIGRIDAGAAHELHVAYHDERAASVWILAHDAADDPSTKAPFAPTEIALARACGCVGAVAIEHGLVHLGGDGCLHRRAATGARLYRELVTHAASAASTLPT